MNKLKDFFYNKNDIIIVLIVLIAAAFIIYTRIGAIMDYPEKSAEKAAAAQTTQTTVEESTSAASSKAASSSSASKNISVVIENSDTASSVAEKLYKSGLIDSASKFNDYIDEHNKTGSIITGTFQIPSNSTYEEILNIITN